MMLLSREDVRQALLAAQGLSTPPEKLATKDDLLATIEAMGYLQIDTIQAVRRSQYLVLWSRLGAYDPQWLDEIYCDRELFEYYAHALCYIPMPDYPIFRGLMLNDEKTGRGWKKWAAQHPQVVEHVLSVVTERGPVSSLDFQSETTSFGWGSVKNERLALNHLFEMGELMVSHREKFRRFFDLRERILPDWDDARAYDHASSLEALVLKTIDALGVAREDWIAPYYYLPKTPIPEILAGLTEEKRIIEARVDGWELPVYIHRGRISLVESILKSELQSTRTTLLSPFDPLVSDRERTLALFDFDYRLEAYTPAKDRIYGYFNLPILYKGQLVGRLDPKAHRKKKLMEIKKITLEPGVKVDQSLVSGLKNSLADFTAWHQMAELEIIETEPQELREALLADD